MGQQQDAKQWHELNLLYQQVLWRPWPQQAAFCTVCGRLRVQLICADAPRDEHEPLQWLSPPDKVLHAQAAPALAHKARSDLAVRTLGCARIGQSLTVTRGYLTH